jgi:pyridoxamine 5'-phosphate oxidase
MESLETQPCLQICEDPGRPPLNEAEMDPDPLRVFGEWFGDAMAAGLPEANAMSLATAGANGRVTCRTVLLKAWDERGFVFFTNYESEKAVQLTENPQAALLFPWLAQGRQIEITGRAERISTAESARYFFRRPLKSRIGAWVSAQSRTITSRALLEAKFDQMMRRFRNGNVPLPDMWGGYRVAPETIEFWQGAPHRLHDRVFYRRCYDGSWRQRRLQP